MKRVLALGGGGSFGAFIVGVLLQLLKNGAIAVKDFFSQIVGTSTGNLCGVGLAFQGIQGLVTIWTEITGTNCIYVSKDGGPIPFNEIFDMAFGSWDGALNDTPLFKLIQKIVVGKPSVPVTSCFVDYEDGQTYFVTALPDGTFELEQWPIAGNPTIMTAGPDWLPEYQKCVLASASTPGGVDSVTLTLPNGQVLKGAFDGGVKDMVPNDYALSLLAGEGEIISISLTDPPTQYNGERNAIGTLMRSIDLLTYGQWVQSQEDLKGAKTGTLNVVMFQKPVLGGDATQFVPATIKQYISAGETAVPSFGQISA
jgi:predicted acylesterase/phospholipase RssA